MLITDDFILINFPKTGSSFARQAIRRAYASPTPRMTRALEKFRLIKPRIMELKLPKIDESLHAHLWDQHGTWRQVPTKFSNRRVVSISREPISRYYSAYRYGWWKQYPPGDLSDILEKYPTFPEISFRQYYEMSNNFSIPNRLKTITPKVSLGLHTIQFIQFFFRDPEKTLRTINDDYIDKKRYLDDLANIHFLEQENLTEDLKNYLLSIGKSKAALSFLDDMKAINTTSNPTAASKLEDRRLDADIKQEILSRDRLIYDIFPHYQSALE